MLARTQPELVRTFLRCAQFDSEDTREGLQQISGKHAAMSGFAAEFDRYSELLTSVGRSPLNKTDAYPCLYDRTSETGFDRHYIYHPAWAARILVKSSPLKHVDISSTLHFATIVSAFLKVDFFDYRPAPLRLSNLSSSAADLINLRFESESIESLSCMHVIEHIGLGRYGDPVDIDGDKKAARELARVLANNGRLIVAIPVGRPRIQFNAHRIYSHEQVLELFSELILLEHALVPDGLAEDGLIQNADSSLINSQSYGCGCYVFTK
jgi:SAM-dependent methyltransferase